MLLLPLFGRGFSCYGEQSLTLLESLVESHGKLDTEESFDII